MSEQTTIQEAPAGEAEPVTKQKKVRKRPVGFRPRIQAIPSVAKAPNERWATDLCRVWAGRDGWTSLALVIDCCR